MSLSHEYKARLFTTESSEVVKENHCSVQHLELVVNKQKFTVHSTRLYLYLLHYSHRTCYCQVVGFLLRGHELRVVGAHQPRFVYNFKELWGFNYPELAESN